MVVLCTKKRLFVIVCVVSACIYLALQWNIICSNREVTEIIERVCRDVEVGQAVGNLCREFCSGALQSHECQPFHGGKEVVFKAEFHGNPVYVKGRKFNVLENKEENLFWLDDNGTEHFPTLEEFKGIVKNHLTHNFNISYTEKVFYNLWKPPLKIESYSPTQNKLLLNLSLKTLWGLLQDPEYVALSIFEHLDLFPELYGTCGGFYIVEELKTIKYPSLVSRTDARTFTRNSKIALGILDLLTDLDNLFEEPVYLCDVKKEHFGISDNGRVKFLDLDNVYLKPIIDRSIGENTHCDNHSDCDFFDCKGMCDLVRHKCFSGVTNNNLQNICEKILLGTESGFQGLSNGLLSSGGHLGSPALTIELKSCANPSFAKDGTRTPADDSHMIKLKSMVKEVITAQSQMVKDNL